MNNIEKIKNNRRPIIIGMFISSIWVNVGLFPIVNFNPNNPVDLGIAFRLVIIVMAFMFHKAIGLLEAVVFSEWSAMFIGTFNVAIASGGLVCRYLLEFGEVSNTYNFTILNISFQVVVFTFLSTIVCVLEEKKK